MKSGMRSSWSYLKTVPFVGFLRGQWLRIHLPMQGHRFSPGLGGVYMPRGDSALEQQLLSLCSRGQEPQLLSPYAPDA